MYKYIMYINIYVYSPCTAQNLLNPCVQIYEFSLLYTCLPRPGPVSCPGPPTPVLGD